MKDQLRKRELLKEWIDKCCQSRCLLFKADELAQDWQFTSELVAFLGNQSLEECIYIMVAEIPELGVVPLYIGQSTNLLERWKSHINLIMKRKGTYAEWYDSLIENEIFKYDVKLYVAQESNITVPPIPHFPIPKSAGSVEYELISLAIGAYPGFLLNKEGNRR